MKNGRPRAQKGGSFERQICTQLSLWWSGGGSDSVFYRTGGSGGRATRRGRKGKTTINHCGDVQASDPSGVPLLKLCTVELKRGFNAFTVHDLLDAPLPKTGVKPAVQKWQQWFDQAEESARFAGSVGWLVIARRDKRRAVAFMSEAVLLLLFGSRQDVDPAPMIALHLSYGGPAVYGVRLDDLLASVTPDDVRAALESSGAA